MESLRQTLKTLFLHKNPDSVLDEIYDEPHLRLKSRCADKEIDKRWFIAAYNNDDDNYYTKDQIENYYNLTVSKWMTKSDDGRTSYREYRSQDKKSVFYVILNFAKSVLKEQGNAPICKYEDLLRWHDISSSLTEDLFCTAFFADADNLVYDADKSKRTFLWRDNIDHDNKALNQICCNKKMVDVHYHLWGSTFVFDLNWLSLMNDIKHRKKEFKKIEQYLDPLSTLFQTEKHSDLYTLVMKAAAIRLCLYHHLRLGKRTPEEIDTVTKNVLMADDALSLEASLLELDTHINATRQTFGRLVSKQHFYPETHYHEKIWDYAIDQHINDVEEKDKTFFVLSGERKLMYDAFRLVYGGDKGFVDSKLSALFYVYILIKNIFRHQIVQLNRSVGFKNFAEYQDRKTTFIKEGSVWDEISAQCAIGSSLMRDNRYVEARICPKTNTLSLFSAINGIDKSVPESLKERYGFVMHFIKSADDRPKDYGIPRHYKLRQTVKQQALAISTINKMQNMSHRIIGVDAANSEIVCPPEVFAPAYRFLRYSSRSHTNSFCGKPACDLGFTFHVGEDFLDIVCGLRAVEETLYFMQMGNGDRFGHALVLGTDVKRYYEQRHHRVSMPQHKILDNIVWLLVKAKECRGYLKVQNDLEAAFERYSRKIYGKALRKITPDTNKIYASKDLSSFSVYDFYQAWLLRGDNPSSYDVDGTLINDFSEGIMSLTSLNDHPKCVQARDNENAKRLFYLYHYSDDVKTQGYETDEIVVSKDVIGIIEELQHKILEKVERKHIAIECNPTSNYRIGEIDLYKNHPMLHFYNFGINHDNIDDHEISVSINTDDKGVFATSQDREFAVMAAALEKQYQHGEDGDSPRTIYEWLNRIRKMGFEQTFLDVD